MPQRSTLFLGKCGNGERSSTKSEIATKKVANFVESVDTSGSSCTAREANTRDHARSAFEIHPTPFGPSPADFTSCAPPSSDGPIGSGSLSEKQAGTTPSVIKIDNHTESGRQTLSERLTESESGRLSAIKSQAKEEDEDYWVFKPTTAGNKLRQQLREEEQQREREEEEKERKRKRTKGQNKALGAFLKTTNLRDQTKEWESLSQRSARLNNACPFCSRCTIILLDTLLSYTHVQHIITF